MGRRFQRVRWSGWKILSKKRFPRSCWLRGFRAAFFFWQKSHKAGFPVGEVLPDWAKVPRSFASLRRTRSSGRNDDDQSAVEYCVRSDLFFSALLCKTNQISSILHTVKAVIVIPLSGSLATIDLS